MKIITKYILILLATVIVSCNNGEPTDEDILVQVGNSYLTKKELIKEIPFGLSKNDSIKFTRAYIRSWIDSKVIGEIAARNIGNNNRINQLVEKYRNELIMWEYRQQMYQSHADNDLSPDTIAAYYESHKSQFKTSSPYIKGIYIKVDDNATHLEQLKTWYRSKKDTDIEQLEKYGLSQAIHYDYFRDKWIEWEQIESKIPYDFGTNADKFIKTHSNQEISIGGFTYLLDITDYLPSNSDMPIDIAYPLIKETLINQRRLQYDRQLRQDLYNKGVEDGDIKILCDLES